MNFHVQKRDGPARIGKLTFDTTSVKTPAILFLQTPRCPSIDFADILLTTTPTQTSKPHIHIAGSIFSPHTGAQKNNDAVLSQYLLFSKDMPTEIHLQAIQHNKKKQTSCCLVPADVQAIAHIPIPTEPQVFIVAHAAQLLQQPRTFVSFITQLREHIGYQQLIFLPGVGDPINLSLLVYCGVDLIDSFSAFLAARNNTLFFPTGHQKTTHIKEQSCYCPVCATLDNPQDMTFTQILHHNYYTLNQEIRTIRNAIDQGLLRELVETRVRVSPSLTALLRTLDSHSYPYVEERIPITRKTQLLATTKDSLYRPEIRRFQERVQMRYQKPPSTRILLLLPCSAKKPYSTSKTHYFFQQQLSQIQNPEVVHEVVITSPLGIVPRELELVYPASSYDVPVTGHWDEDEKKMIRTLLHGFLQTNTYEKILVHLPHTLTEFIKDLLPNPIITCKDTPTSPDSLQTLYRELSQAASSYEHVPRTRRHGENLESLASYQFGKKEAQQLLKDCTVKGKYPYLKFFSHQKQIGMLTPERGLLSLTINGAERLLPTKTYWVDIEADIPLKGSVLAPGVNNADPSIRIGDDVILVHNHLLRGVGIAQMNGAEMRKSCYGEAVKIRHRVD